MARLGSGQRQYRGLSALAWLCRLGRALLLEAGLVSAMAGANRVGGGYGYGHWWLRATAVQAQ